MYKKILVPLDGSERAERILPHVEELALKFSCSVRLLQVIERVLEVNSKDVFIPQGSLFTAAQRSAQTYIDSVARGMMEKGIKAEGWVLIGNVVTTICQAAEQENADLIAMASHGRTGAAQVFYGSIAAGVLNQVDRPLLIIRSRKD